MKLIEKYDDGTFIARNQAPIATDTSGILYRPPPAVSIVAIAIVIACIALLNRSRPLDGNWKVNLGDREFLTVAHESCLGRITLYRYGSQIGSGHRRGSAITMVIYGIPTSATLDGDVARGRGFLMTRIR